MKQEKPTSLNALQTRSGFGGGFSALRRGLGFCTSVAFHRPRLGMVHSRNVDWPLPQMKSATIVLDCKADAGTFQAVSVPGMVGVLSGVAKGRFSITVNSKEDRSHYVPNIRGWGATLLVRWILGYCSLYDEALRELKKAYAFVPFYVMLVGLKPSQAVVVEVNRNGKKQDPEREYSPRDGNLLARNAAPLSLGGGEQPHQNSPLSGVFDAFAAGNLIVFCSCVRGLLEASADSWDSLGPVTPTLAASKWIVAAALNNELNKRHLAGEIEQRLIHFTFARKAKKGETLPDFHLAKTVASYLQHFEKEQPSIRQFYGVLCDIVHPGANSILTFARPQDKNAASVVLTFEGEERSLAHFAVAFRHILADIMAAGFNTGIFVLRTLNALPAVEVHTPFLDSLPYEPMAAWQSIEQMLAAEASARSREES